MMKPVYSIIFFLLFLLQASAPDSWAASRGIQGIRITTENVKELYLYRDYHALVIGIGDYENWPELPNAANDAREVAGKLAGLGFQVKTMIDPGYAEIRKALNELVYQTGRVEDRAILLYFAGHGETETLADGTRMGYIVPRECPLSKKDPMGFAACAISMKDIESISMRIKSRHVIMLFDSCFSGSLFNIVRAVPDDITEKAALPVRQYITAGREDEQVPDRSMFKRVFLNGLEGDADLTKDGYITGSELGMYLSERVVNYTRRAQHPQYGKINNPSLDRGDFVFVPPKRLSVATAGEPAKPPKETVRDVAARAAPPAPTAASEKPVQVKLPETSSQAVAPITQAKLAPAEQPFDTSKHLAAMTAPSFPPAGTRYTYRVQRLKESRIEKYVVLGEGVYEGRKVHQVRIEGKDGLVLYDLATGNWIRTVVEGKTVGKADPYEDILRYPVEVGNKYECEFYYFDQALSGNTKTNVVVKSVGEVRVPAGTFLAYEVVAEEIFSAAGVRPMSTGWGIERRLKKFWYSPDLKIIVKMEDFDWRAGVTTRTELLEYAKADPAQETVAEMPKADTPKRPPAAREKPKPQGTAPITQVKLAPAKQTASPPEHLTAMTAPSFPPRGTRYAYRIQKLGVGHVEKFVVLGEGVYEGRKVHQVRLEGKDGLVLYDLKTGNWMRTVVEGKTVGNADPYEDILRYPLEVGNKYECEFLYFDYILSGNTKTNIEVMAYEEVSVPAGTFMAYKIFAEEIFVYTGNTASTLNVSTHGSQIRVKTFWFSPDLKIVIKLEDTDRRFSIMTKTELVEYSKP